ncbi:MAG: hypothetical protein M3237_09460 [Actinomycetota bacterium]|nr:hypothetical protein [Actinomycetota bacterium]
MRLSSRLLGRVLPGLVAPLLLIPLAGCTGDDATADTVAEVRAMSAAQAEAVLLTRHDLGPGYKEQAVDEDGDNDGMDCLSLAAREFESSKAATELEVEYRKPGPADTLGEVSVLSGFSSYVDKDRAEVTLDELRGAMQDCPSARYEQDDATISFDISVSDDKTVEALDQQVNITLDGDITIGDTVLPLVIELRHFRIANHAGTVSVSVLNAPDQVGEIDRLVGLGVDRFVDVADATS